MPCAPSSVEPTGEDRRDEPSTAPRCLVAGRTDVIVESLTEAFAPLMKADLVGFRTKFRKMAKDPFAFYRGSACLFTPT